MNIIYLRELTACLFIGGVITDVEGCGIFRQASWTLMLMCGCILAVIRER